MSIPRVKALPDKTTLIVNGRIEIDTTLYVPAEVAMTEAEGKLITVEWTDSLRLYLKQCADNWITANGGTLGCLELKR